MKLSIHEFNRLISNFAANVPTLDNIYVVFFKPPIPRTSLKSFLILWKSLNLTAIIVRMHGLTTGTKDRSTLIFSEFILNRNYSD